MLDGMQSEPFSRHTSQSKLQKLCAELSEEEEDEEGKVGWGVRSLVVITDPGKDQDDELALILLRTLSDMGLVEVRAVVTNLTPAGERGKLALATLDAVGLEGVPVGVGSCGGRGGAHASFSLSIGEANLSYYAGEPTRSGSELLLSTLQEAGERSITMLLLSSLTDVADFILDHEELFAAKVDRASPPCATLPCPPTLSNRALLPSHFLPTRSLQPPRPSPYISDPAPTLPTLP